MNVRLTIAAAATLLLSACGGGERYAVSAAEATTLLAGLGSSPAISPMPVMLSNVRVAFETLPTGNGVQWAFRNDDGEQLGQIVALVEPDGESGSKVNVNYIEPLTAVTSHTGGQYQVQLKGNVKQLLAEAVDSTLERRPFDHEVRKQIELAMISEGFGGAINEASRRMDQYSSAKGAEDRYGYDTGRETGPPPQPADASKPSTDLSRFQ